MFFISDDFEISDYYRFEKTFNFEKTGIHKQIRIEQSWKEAIL